MKKILFPALIAALLSSCASDNGTVDENKFKTPKPVKKTDGAKGLVPIIPTPAEECVTINGKFKRPSTKKEGLNIINFDEIVLATKREGDKVSYGFNGEFIVADGEANEKDGAKSMAVCNKNSYEITILKADKVSRVQFLLVDENNVKITAEGEEVAQLAGTFTKEGAAPAPQPQPEPAPAPAPGEGEGEDEETL